MVRFFMTSPIHRCYHFPRRTSPAAWVVLCLAGLGLFAPRALADMELATWSDGLVEEMGINIHGGEYGGIYANPTAT